jgi:hypothetical protein
MPRVRFETTFPVFERAKTVHALDGTVTVIGLTKTASYKLGLPKLRNMTAFHLEGNGPHTCSNKFSRS